MKTSEIDIIWEDDVNWVYKTWLDKEIDAYKSKKEELVRENTNNVDVILVEYLKSSELTEIKIEWKFEKDIKASKKNELKNLELEFNLWKNIFILNWRYYHCLKYTYAAQDLFLSENQATKFNEIQEVDWKIIMYNEFWKDFIIFDREIENVFYKWKKWEEVLIMDGEVSIYKPYYALLLEENDETGNKTEYTWKVSSVLNLKTWEETFDEYEDKYTFLWEIFWNLIFPEYFNKNINDIEWFLWSTFFWDFLAIFFKNQDFKRKSLNMILSDKDLGYWLEAIKAIFKELLFYIKNNSAEFSQNFNFKALKIKNIDFLKTEEYVWKIIEELDKLISEKK